MSSYSRVFITLKEDKTGFGLASRQPVGRCVIEVRGEHGKITFTVQNLKPGIVYEALLMRANPSEAEGIPLGLIHVDEKGKGELKCSIIANNVLNSQIPVTEFNISAVFVAGDKDLVAPLVGFKDESMRWRQNFRLFKQPVPTKPKPAEQPSAQPPNPTTEPPPEHSPKPTKQEQEPPPPGAYQQLAQNLKEELEVLEHFAFAASTEKETDELHNIFNNNIKIVPFKHQDTPIEWVRITTEELELLPSPNIGEYINHPVLISSYEEYHHLILGRVKKNDLLQYTIGVPGIYDSQHQLKDSLFAFNRFKSCDSIHPEDGAYGYWLLEIEKEEDVGPQSS